MFRAITIFLFGFIPLFVLGQVPFPQLPQPIATYSFEDKDWGVEAITTSRRAPYHGSTPTSIPGARTIKTLELKGLLQSDSKVVVIDVLDSRSRNSIPRAFKMSGAGDGQFYAVEKSRFATALEKLCGGDKTRPIVFLCLNSECWLSYNASLHALEAGYTDVIWYRGGISAWTGAGFDLTKPEVMSW